ncbi:hypothetical protein [Pontibacter sp. G13]|uniref:hypothetical protein n=1 Tax=Pontibacter sp. G13 TaxID=3074898 RepID=UPI00288BACC4|nr:hypothetical protein [Pontibacter sp. G13]WNJ16315.1 hypothetical protein RJD25_15735 [Pontibacter sp. G13]
MNRFFSSFAPAFLKRWDSALLMNYPRLWAARIHIIGLGLALMAIGLVKVYLLTPVSTHSVPTLDEPHYLLAWIPAGLILLYWGWGVYQYRTGRLNLQGFKVQQFGHELMQLAVVVLLAFSPLLWFNMVGQKVNDRLSKDDLVQAEKDLEMAAPIMNRIMVLNASHETGTLDDYVGGLNIRYHELEELAWVEEYMKEFDAGKNSGRQPLGMEAAQAFNRFIRNFTDYKADFIPVSSQTILVNGSAPVAHGGQRNVLLEAAENFERLENWLAHGDNAYSTSVYFSNSYSSHGFKDDIWPVFLIVGLIGWMLFQMLMVSHIRVILIAGVSAFVVVIGAAMASSLGKWAWQDRHAAESLYLFAITAIALALAFSNKRTPKWNTTKRVAITLVLGFMPLYFLILGEFTDIDLFASQHLGKEEYQIYGGVGTMLALWFGVFRWQLQGMQVRPQAV